MLFPMPSTAKQGDKPVDVSYIFIASEYSHVIVHAECCLPSPKYNRHSSETLASCRPNAWKTLVY